MIGLSVEEIDFKELIELKQKTYK